MAGKYHLVEVCGYGCHLRDTEGRDTPLRPYLDKVALFIKRHLPDMVIFCGGYTQRKSAPGVSESGLMHDYVSSQLRSLGEVYNLSTHLFIEDNSYTTYGNIKMSASHFKKFFGSKECRITNFCEATRSANVIMLSRHFMDDLIESVDDITVETGSWERADPFKQAGNLIYNKLAIKYPWLGLAEREHRKRIRRAEYA